MRAPRSLPTLFAAARMPGGALRRGGEPRSGSAPHSRPAPRSGRVSRPGWALRVGCALVVGGALLAGCSEAEETAAPSAPVVTTPAPAQQQWPPRPQEPKPPWPYNSQEVGYPSGDITIAGTLTEPNTPGPHPAVVLITGSGPQNRDEELLGHKPFLLLADTLTRAGYAVLRTDDRGVGGTTGTLAHSSYLQLTDDIAAGMAFLRGRPEIDATRIGLLGHSEGGYLAPLYAARPDSGVAFVMLLAGPAVRGSEVLLEQTHLILDAEGATPEQLSDEIGFLSALTSVLRIGDLEAARRYAHAHNDSLPVEQRAPAAVVDDMTSTYTAALLNYDPAEALSALRIPALAVFGGKDLQVPPAQSEGPMRAHLAAGPDATVHVFDGLNHLFQPAGTGVPAEYAVIETTMDPAVLDYLTAWLTQRFPTGA